ncbi:hypothetical protein N7537_009167 [Penicillium hordei]|uniref:Uncharacterized protein n=1 Tax=Penicillium hordei TaxID=40994 RepID=A0AAD6DS67_9EURO|nr:uncharacterized protein N7537_009167 [Penicillium hordei]KAJ5592263.1 hypothetical protein N7537_009167 [Penicillium hordei]
MVICIKVCSQNCRGHTRVTDKAGVTMSRDYLRNTINQSNRSYMKQNPIWILQDHMGVHE